MDHIPRLMVRGKWVRNLGQHKRMANRYEQKPHTRTALGCTVGKAVVTGGDVIFPLQKGAMGFWKFPPFLVLSILVLNQAGMLQAAPFRWALENGFDPATLTNKEMRLLLAAMMNDYEQMKACELKQETGGLQVKALPSAQHLPSPLAYQEDVS
ncbi:hypothetical protein EI555_015091 [Monodon monoceros]|uniref:Uncharacterized protein n=1 Tax=Monodon monoceros TaxID=40151 RepID=A0A4V5P650_MONMO|nr:hypothetical protein EI555_015091 [Monodon monoceros]